MNNRISVCIIAKNEENYLENCLKSVLPIAYEIIVLDTGSTDKTKEIAAKYAKVYEAVWEDDFSKTRNKCIAYATGDWILSIDADEILTEETRKRMLPFLEAQSLSEKPLIYNFMVISPETGEASIRASYFKNALFRNGYDIYFIRPVHEHLSRLGGEAIQVNCPFFNFLHLGEIRPMEELRKKSEKYIARMQKVILENIDKSDNYYYWYYIGNTYAIINQPDQALDAFSKSACFYQQKYSDKINKFYGNLLSHTILTLIEQKYDYQKAIPLIEELLLIAPDFVDAWYYFAFCQQNIGNYQEAVSKYKYALSLLNSDKTNSLYLSSMGSSQNLMILNELARCCIILGENLPGLNYLLQARKISPTARPILFHLIKYYLLQDNLPGALEYYFEHENITANEKLYLKEISKMSPDNYLYKSKILYFLKNMAKHEGWLKEELISLKNKIAEIETIISLES